MKNHKDWIKKFKINSGILIAGLTAIVVEGLTLLIEHLKGLI